jgi:hypothetical protein
LLGCGSLHAAESRAQPCDEPFDGLGSYFSRKTYLAAPLPRYAETRPLLPAPILAGEPQWIAVYWKAWELAFRNFYQPVPGSGFVSQFIDAGSNDNIFLWDSSFMTLFMNYGGSLVPGISTLDNFYARQHRDGEICREIVRKTGACLAWWVNRDCKPLASKWGWLSTLQEMHQARVRDDSSPVRYRGRAAPTPNPVFMLDALNHPILAWAELESYQVTGDKQRLLRVWEPLVRYYGALKKYLRQGNGLYVTDWASMDNSPRNPYLRGGGIGIDISSEMVLFARSLARIAAITGRHRESERYAQEASALTRLINRLMWDDKRRFYSDLTLEGERAPVKTVAAYWTLLARVASPEQSKWLANALSDPRTFGRPNRVPSLAADEALYDRSGGYWHGAVWAPTTTMVIRGLESYGYHDLARAIALQNLELVAKVYRETGTIWENYSPDEAKPGVPADPDFVGWSGLTPILYLLEYGVGLKPDAPDNKLTWELVDGGRRGCDRYRFNGHIVSLLAQRLDAASLRYRLTVVSDGPFTLQVAYRGRSEVFAVRTGRQQFVVQ